MTYSATDTVEKLVEWVKASSEDAIIDAAQRILEERISSEALEIISNEHESDEALWNTILQCRKLL
jgi:hypothetical protein